MESLSIKHSLALILACSLPSPLTAFDTITELLDYANSRDEYPDSDLDIKGLPAQTNPTFTLFYPTIDPGFLRRLSCHFNVIKPHWCFSDLTAALHQLYATESKRPWNKQHDHTHALEDRRIISTLIGSQVAEGKKYIVVGDLSGAIHSLARIVEYWRSLGFMDEDFVIKDTTITVVFLGNFIGSSAYNLETLTALGIIAHRNPANVFILCGGNEDRQRWYETPLYHAIQVRSHLNRDRRRLCYAVIDSIFALFPRGFLLTSATQEEAVILSAAQVFDTIVPQELTNCLPTLTGLDVRGCTLTGHASEMGKSNEKLVSLIETRRVWNTIAQTPPLEKTNLAGIKGTVWDIISGSTRALRSLYRVQFNGYVVITFKGAHFEHSTLEYIGRRIDFEDTFSNRITYNLITGNRI